MNKFIFFLFFSFSTLYINAQESLIVGYLPTYRFKTSSEIEFCKLTHLNICFVSPNKKGILNKIDSLPEMMKIIRESNPNIKINISLAGGALHKEEALIWKKYVDIATNRPILINSIINYVKEYGFDGVDMDLEWKNVTKGYSPFVLALKVELDKLNKDFTVAFPAIKRYKYVTDEALNCFDYVNIMAYDESGSWAPKDAKPHSSYEFALKSIFFWNELQKVPKEKLNLGLPFYAYNFTNPRRTTSLKFKEIVKMNPENRFTDSTDLIFYNGIPTIEKKVEYATKNVAGVMIWELGQDSTNEFSLLTAIHYKIKKLGANDSLGNCGIPEEQEVIIEISTLEKFKQSILFETQVSNKTFSIESKNINDLTIVLKNKKERIIRLRTYKQGYKRFFKVKKLRKGIYTIFVSDKEFSLKKKLTIEKGKKRKRNRTKK